MKPSPTPPLHKYQQFWLVVQVPPVRANSWPILICFTLLKHKCELLGFETNHVMQNWLTSMFHKGMEGNSQNPSFCNPSFFFKTSGTGLRPNDPGFVQTEITALIHFLRRKANQATVGTPAFSQGFSLSMFFQSKKLHSFQVFHSSTAVQQNRHKPFFLMPPEVKKAVLSWTCIKEDRRQNDP